MSFPVSPFFNVTSGQAFTSIKSTSKPCEGAASSNGISDNIGLLGNGFTVPSSGTYHFKANWVMSFSVDLKVNSGTSSQTSYAFFYVVGQSYLFCPNGTTYSQTNYPVVTYAVFSSGTYSHTYSKFQMTVFLNGTLAKLPKHSNQTYSFLTDLEVIVATGAPPGAVSTSASVNMGSAGKSGTLVSYTMGK